jgi:hypothetical protein
MTESEAVMPEMTGSEVKFQTDLMSAEHVQQLLPKLTDEQRPPSQACRTRRIAEL